MTTTPDVTIGQTVYVTKYALTKGIQERVLLDLVLGHYAKVEMPDTVYGWDLVNRSGWATTREDAVIQATALRDRKIDVAEKQLARLRALTF